MKYVLDFFIVSNTFIVGWHAAQPVFSLLVMINIVAVAACYFAKETEHG